MARFFNSRLFLILLGAVLISACKTLAFEPRVSGEVSVGNEDARVDVVFGERERRLIRNYYASDQGLPPGLAKKEQLPPGLARQVQRNGRLPPGLEGKRLPAELERQLTRLPDNYARVRVGLDVVLLNTDTRVVVDIIEDIGRY